MIDVPFFTFNFGGFIEWKQQKLFWGISTHWGQTVNISLVLDLSVPGIQVSIYLLEFEQFAYLIA